jgi:hypothetical protein
VGHGALTDELFEVDPRGFVSARDRLVKQLRADGKRDDAAAVRALRRPSVAAWALNQVARHNRAMVDALLTAIDQARTAQDDVLAGGDREGLRAALAERRHALHEVLEQARAVIERSQRSADTAARDIESALQGQLTPAFVETLRRGTLVDLVDGGADDEDDLSALLAASAGSTPQPRESGAAVARREKLAREIEALEADVDVAASTLSRANEAVEESERAADDARRARDGAQQNYDRAMKALDRARAKLDGS